MKFLQMETSELGDEAPKITGPPSSCWKFDVTNLQTDIAQWQINILSWEIPSRIVDALMAMLIYSRLDPEEFCLNI